jgi:hypothetical protein
VGDTFKLYTSYFYALRLQVISVKGNSRISRVKFQERSFHQVSLARRNLGNIYSQSLITVVILAGVSSYHLKELRNVTYYIADGGGDRRVQGVGAET